MKALSIMIGSLVTVLCAQTQCQEDHQEILHKAVNWAIEDGAGGYALDRERRWVDLEVPSSTPTELVEKLQQVAALLDLPTTHHTQSAAWRACSSDPHSEDCLAVAGASFVTAFGLERTSETEAVVTTRVIMLDPSPRQGRMGWTVISGAELKLEKADQGWVVVDVLTRIVS